MKRILLVLLAFVLVASTTAIAAFIDYDRVTTYEDGSPIPAAKIPTIRYRGYYGPASTGPWTSGSTVVDNLAIAAPDPFPGESLWYTVEATLDNVTGQKGAAMSKTVPPLPPGGPRLRGVR